MLAAFSYSNSQNDQTSWLVNDREPSMTRNAPTTPHVRNVSNCSEPYFYWCLIWKVTNSKCQPIPMGRAGLCPLQVRQENLRVGVCFCLNFILMSCTEPASNTKVQRQYIYRDDREGKTGLKNVLSVLMVVPEDEGKEAEKMMRNIT